MEEAGVNFVVIFKDGALTLSVPGQAPYPLENVSGRRYKLGSPAPDGFFATFRPVKDKESETELFIEQPQGDVVARKIKPPSLPVGATIVTDGDLLLDVMGSYQSESSNNVIEIRYLGNRGHRLWRQYDLNGNQGAGVFQLNTRDNGLLQEFGLASEPLDEALRGAFVCHAKEQCRERERAVNAGQYPPR